MDFQGEMHFVSYPAKNPGVKICPSKFHPLVYLVTIYWETIIIKSQKMLSNVFIFNVFLSGMYMACDIAKL